MEEKIFKTKYEKKKWEAIHKAKAKASLEEKSCGRPQAIIDWNFVDSLLEAGCSGASIANSIGVNKSTIYERCLTDKGIPFSEYSQQKSEKGENRLRVHQYAKALGLTDNGDNTLLIWLGKTRLKQKEHEDQVITKEVESKFEQLMRQMQKDKGIVLKDDDNGSSITETA